MRRNARALFGRVARELDRLMVAHGKPTTIVSDNGTCIAAASILMDEEAQSLQLRPRARGSTSCVRRRGAQSCAEIRRCRAAAAPDRPGFHLAQAVDVALQWSWPQAVLLRRDPPVAATTECDGPGKEYEPPQRYPRPKGKYDTLCPFSRPHPSKKNLMIPGASGSEIAKIPPMDEVLRRHSESLRKAAAKTTGS